MAVELLLPLGITKIVVTSCASSSGLGLICVRMASVFSGKSKCFSWRLLLSCNTLVRRKTPCTCFGGFMGGGQIMLVPFIAGSFLTLTGNTVYPVTGASVCFSFFFGRLAIRSWSDAIWAETHLI